MLFIWQGLRVLTLPLLTDTEITGVDITQGWILKFRGKLS